MTASTVLQRAGLGGLARSCGNRAFGGGTAIVGVIYSAIRTLFRAVSTVTWGLVQLQLPALGSFRPLALAVGLESGMTELRL